MIKFIKPRSRRNIECMNCGALLSYEKEDVKKAASKKFNETAEIESGMDDVLELLEDDKIGCGGYYRAVKSHMEYGIKVIDSAELVSISITLVPSSAEYYVSRKETRNY